MVRPRRSYTAAPGADVVLEPFRRVADAVVGILPKSAARAIRFRYVRGFWPSLSAPTGINEKINWRIVRDDRPMWDWTCDKIAMKTEVARRAPGLKVPAVLWSGTDVADLAGRDFGDRWILKGNRGTGQIYLGRGHVNMDEIKRTMLRWKMDRPGRVLGETAYLRAAPGFFVEQWVGEPDHVPTDYKVFVFDGVARFLTVHTGRFHDHHASLYSPSWERLAARLPGAPAHDQDLPQPETLAELIHGAELVAAGFDFIRVDLFVVSDGVWFGETTPYPWSGLNQLIPQSFELEAGCYWTLPDLS